MSVCIWYVIPAKRKTGVGWGLGWVNTAVKRTCLVLQRVKSLLALYDLCDIVSHNVNSVVDLSLNGSGLWVPSSASAWGRGIG
jgi:hypothetical protein